MIRWSNQVIRGVFMHAWNVLWLDNKLYSKVEPTVLQKDLSPYYDVMVTHHQIIVEILKTIK